MIVTLIVLHSIRPSANFQSLSNSTFCFLFLAGRRSVMHAHSWKLMKPHMMAVIQDIIFPIMQYTEADQQLWEDDPYEYIRVKYGTTINW